MKKYLSFIFISTCVLFGYLVVSAGPLDTMTYPIGPLGNCASKQECKAYCDQPQNISACIDFAEQHKLISKEEAQRGRKFSKVGAGPGGCANMNQCKAYCDNVNHLEECIDFASKNGLMSKAEMKEAQQVLKAVKKGAKMPGGCGSKASCDVYCENPQHIEECIAFASAAGFMSKKEMEEVKRLMPIMKAGGMPGGCMSKSACDAYCNDTAHNDECMDFALKAGFITPEEAEMMKKTGGVGPGGCRREECDNFCKNPANQQACFKFGLKYGMIPEKDLQEMRGHLAETQKALNEAPEEVAACLISALGADVVAKIRAGDLTAMIRPDMGKAMEPCWEAWHEKEEERRRQEEERWEQQRRENEERGWEPPEGYPPNALSPEQMMQQEQQWEQQRRENEEHGWGPPPEEDYSEIKTDGYEPSEEQEPMQPPAPSSNGERCGDATCMPGYYCVDEGMGRCCPYETEYSITEGTCQ